VNMRGIGLSKKGHWGFAEKESEREEESEEVEQDGCMYANV